MSAEVKGSLTELLQNYLPNTQGYSPQARLLAFLEQANLQKKLDFRQPAFTGPFNALVPNPQFAAVFAQKLPVALCPSDPAPTHNTGAGGSLYCGINYMVIPRSESLTEDFDDRFERKTDAHGFAHFTPKLGGDDLVVAHLKTEESGEGFEATSYSATLTVFVPEICTCCGE